MASSPSSSSTRVGNYDVFLSFHGADTRSNIVSHLHFALRISGIVTFKDDVRLEPGDIISNELIEAINTSVLAVVVISKNYATSKWCLEELRLIMELHGENKIRVIPMFYGVEPSDVRHQTGSFEAAFQKYQNLDPVPEKVPQWKRALNQVGHLSGFHSKTWKDDSTMIAQAVESISNQLLMMRPTSGVDLVGMEGHMVKMHFLMNMKSENEVLMIGIWGMGGVGKTTIAKCLYDRISREFQARYFIEDIKKIYKNKSPSYLQEIFLFKILGGQQFVFRGSEEAGSKEIKARLGHRKVFVVLDGVDKAEQIHALAKEITWFGPGSRIIITTQDRDLLKSCGVNNVHHVKCFDDKDALQVFKKLAPGVFEKLASGGETPPGLIEKLYMRASQLAHGLPSALVAHASYFSKNTTIEEWEDELGLLEKWPHKNVEEILRNSYEDLDEQDKIAFLHVACLLNGYPLNHVTSLLDDGRPRMNHLTAKSLISISWDGCINMHFLVVQTGRAIVRQESRNMPSRQRFLWDTKEIYNVIDNNIGTDEIEGISLHMCEMDDKLRMSNRASQIMHNIKFLKYYQHLADAKFNVKIRSDGFYFPTNLRLLYWDMYPLKTLPSRFRHHHLVELNLRHSNLQSLWDRNVNLPSLPRLDVTGSKNLIELPAFPKDMEELIVEDCISLRNIPKSLRSLHKLTKLNTIHCDICRGVRFNVHLHDRLPETERLGGITVAFPTYEILEFLFLTDISIEGQICISSSGFEGNADHLSFGFKKQITDQSMKIEQEPVNSQHKSDMRSYLDRLKSLEVKQFNYMEDRYPFDCHSFDNFPSLTELQLINLNIEYIPENIILLQFLKRVDFGGNDFVNLPTSMGQLSQLKYLSLRNCRKLKALPQLAQVETLILSDCVNLRSLLELDHEPHSRTYCLLELWLDNCNNVETLSRQLDRFSKLTYLDLSRHNFVMGIKHIIGRLLSLETLFLNNCKQLLSVEGLPLSLMYLYAHGCDSLENVSVSPNHSIKHLDLNHCPRLNREEHKHLLNLFIYEGHSQKGSRQCASLPETKVTSTKIKRIGNFVRFLTSALRRH